MSKIDDKVVRPKRWSAKKKLEVVLRLFRGEPIDGVSRDIGVDIYRLDEWKREATFGMEANLKERVNDPLQTELSRAKERIGELSMEVELLKEKSRKQGPLVLRRLKK